MYTGFFGLGYIPAAGRNVHLQLPIKGREIFGLAGRLLTPQEDMFIY